MVLSVGIIGCGNIAPAYILGCGKYPEFIRVTACADLSLDRAQAFAAQNGLRALSVADMLADPSIDIVINLTVPAVHAEVNLQIIGAGKHVYGEKPLALTREDGQRVLEAAKAAGVRVGCAPDTILGGGIQTARDIIDSGVIGRPVAATAFMAGHGPDAWHPNPFFFYQFGGGPVLDMGPYYLTTLVYLLGAVQGISAVTGRAFDERVAGAENVRGQAIPVNVSTHAAGTLTFAGGAIATTVLSFDVWKHNLPRIEIYGTEGSLSIPDPNTFDGVVQVWEAATKEWRSVPLTSRTDIQRGAGVAEMARAISEGVPHIASGDLAYHVLDVMLSYDDASAAGRHLTLESRTDRPLPLHADLR